MNPDFQAAAVSYFGLPEGTTLIPSDTGYLAFHVVLDAATLTGIGERMRTMAQVVEAQPVFKEDPSTAELPVSEMRAEYNRMLPVERAEWGSFGRYAVLRQRDGREVKHVDAPVEADSGLPEAVWVHGGDLSNAQISMASDHRADTNEWLVQVIMLDVAQMAKYVPMRRANA